MAEDKSMRLSQVAKILNTGTSSVVSRLSAKGFKVDSNPNTKLNMEQLEVLAKEYKSTELLNGARRTEPSVAVVESPRRQEEDVILYRRDDAGRPIVDAKADQGRSAGPAEAPKTAPAEPKPATESVQTGLPGLKVIGKIDLNAKPAPKPAPAPEAKAPTPAAPQEVKPTPAPPSQTESRPVSPGAETPRVETPKPVAPQPPVEAPRVETPKPVIEPVEAKAAPVQPVAPTPQPAAVP